MNSELLECSFEKHTLDREFHLLEDELVKLLNVEIEGQVFLDDEDYRRLGYLMRKHPRPTSLKMLLTDGHVEDFFGAWCDPDDGNGFDPDRNLDILFGIYRRHHGASLYRGRASNTLVELEIPETYRRRS